MKNAIKRFITRPKKKILMLCLTGVLGANAGCAGIYDHYVSKADSLCSTCEEWNNGIVIIESNDAKLVLQPDNSFNIDSGILAPFPMTGQKQEITQKYRSDHKPFSIEVAIQPYGENVTFNPREVYLELETGKSIQAIGYYKPNRIQLRPNPDWGTLFGPTVPLPLGTLAMFTTARAYVPVPDPVKNISQNFPVSKQDWIAFRVYFDTPIPNPGTPFSVIIKGLEKIGKSVHIDAIAFRDKMIYRQETP